MAYMVASEFRSALAGVTSVDGSCRPQMVPDESATGLGGVLRALKARTGVGVVLNTSFNIHGEPLVCTPQEAIDVYTRTGADALAIGPYLVERPPARTRSSADSRIKGLAKSPPGLTSGGASPRVVRETAGTRATATSGSCSALLSHATGPSRPARRSCEYEQFLTVTSPSGSFSINLCLTSAK